MSQLMTPRRSLLILHPAFAMTGVLQAISGPLMPALAAHFHLTDGASGVLFTLYFAGTAIGATLCRRRYARLMTTGFALLAAITLCLAFSNLTLLYPLFLLMGIACGVPMTAVSMFVGRNFTENCAPTLTFLNFTWSVGALAAPLLVAPLLAMHSYRAVYLVLALACTLMSMFCSLLPDDGIQESHAGNTGSTGTQIRLILMFAFLAFLQVGIENTALAWLSTYSLRATGAGIALAAASSSLYWMGYLASRGFSSLLLLRFKPLLIFRQCVVVALAGACLLAIYPSGWMAEVEMFLLGTALAPIFPLLLSLFFERAENSGDSRWVLALCGFGGSILPAITGILSAQFGTLRAGLATVPLSLLTMLLVLPLLSTPKTKSLSR